MRRAVCLALSGLCSLLMGHVCPVFLQFSGSVSEDRGLFLETYRKLMVASTNVSVSPEELSRMLDTQDYFSLERGTSEREPLRNALLRLREYFFDQLVGDPQLLAELRSIIEENLKSTSRESQAVTMHRIKARFVDPRSFVIRGYPGNEGAIAISPDSKFIAMETWKNRVPYIGIWNLESREKLTEFSLELSPYTSLLQFTQDGQFLYRNKKYTGRHTSLVDIGSRSIVLQDNLTFQLISSLGKVVHTIAEDKVLQTLSRKGELLNSFQVPDAYAFPGGERSFEFSAVLSHDERWVAIQSGKYANHVEVWNLRTGRLLFNTELFHQNLQKAKMRFSPDGRWLDIEATKPDNRSLFFRIDTVRGEIVLNREKPAHWGALMSHTSADGQTFALLSPERLTIHDSFGEVISEIKPSAEDAGLRVSPSGRLALTVSRIGNIRIWEPSGERAKRNLSISTINPKNALGDLSVKHSIFSPDERFLAVINSSGNARVWEIRRGRLVSAPIVNRPDDTLTLQMSSPDGRYFVTARRNGTAEILDLHSIFEEVE